LASHIYETLLTALRGHWKAHAEAYPRKFILSPAQHKELTDTIASVRKGIAASPASDHMKFMGARLEIRADYPSVMVSVDGAETPLTTQ
jgi:hypothetical protein